MMGQSIAVKSDQLAYLIPAQCIALDASGKSVLGGSSNPVTKEQYYDLIWDQSNKKVRDESDVNKVVDAIRNKLLADLKDCDEIDLG